MPKTENDVTFAKSINIAAWRVRATKNFRLWTGRCTAPVARVQARVASSASSSYVSVLALQKGLKG